jgi:hypothetical protein
MNELSTSTTVTSTEAQRVVQDRIFSAFEVSSTTQVQFVSNTVQRIVSMHHGGQQQQQQQQQQSTAMTVAQPDDSAVLNEVVLTRQSLVLAIREQTEAMQGLLAVEGQARHERHQQQVAEQQLQAGQQRVQYHAASAFLNQLLETRMRNTEALSKVLDTFPQVQNPREPRILDELRWLVQQMLMTGILTDSQFLQLSMNMTHKSWRQAFLGLTGRHGGLPSRKRVRQVELPDALVQSFRNVMFETGDVYYALYAVLQQYGGGSESESVAVFCRLVLLNDCPRLKRTPPAPAATCILMANRLIDAAQRKQGDLQGMLGTRRLMGILSSCALWTKTITTVQSSGGIMVNLRTNPIITTWSGDIDALFLFVLQHLVVCKSGEYINYVSPLYHLQNLPYRISPHTLRDFLDDSRMVARRATAGGVACTVCGIPGLESQMVHFYTPSIRLQCEQWQRGIEVRDGNSHHLPWALGYVEAGSIVSAPSIGLCKLSLQSLGFDAAPHPEIYNKGNGKGWYLSKATDNGFGIISANPHGGPGMAFVHYRRCEEAPPAELLTDLVLPDRQHNIPPNAVCMRALMQAVGMTMSDNVEAAIEGVHQEMPCALYLRLEAFDVCKGPWRVHPQHATMCQMSQALQDCVTVGRCYPSQSS